MRTKLLIWYNYDTQKFVYCYYKGYYVPHIGAENQFGYVLINIIYKKDLCSKKHKIFKNRKE